MTNENENAGKECVRMSMWAPGMILAAADAIINTTHYPHANSGISPAAAQYSQGPAPRPALYLRRVHTSRPNTILSSIFVHL